MSFLQYIPQLARRNLQLAWLLFNFEKLNFEFLVLATELEIEYLKEETRKTRKRKRRSVWVRPYLRRRIEKGQYENLMRELACEDPMLYTNFLRVGQDIFDDIVQRVRPLIEKQRTWWREPLDVGLRVAITLRFLATGNSYKSLGYAFRVAHNTISLLVPETCRAIIAAYGDEVLQMPNTYEQWKTVAKVFEERWNFPHTIGAIDGKHVRIKNPSLAGSHYYNYKKFYSIVLLALVDADYKFMYIDVGAVGAESDGGVFAQTKLARLINTNEINLPPPEPLASDPDGPPIGYFMLGDDAFALKTWMMKPYPSRGLTVEERIFNYRQSRARRVVENAFGILANR